MLMLQNTNANPSVNISRTHTTCSPRGFRLCKCTFSFPPPQKKERETFPPPHFSTPVRQEIQLFLYVFIPQTEYQLSAFMRVDVDYRGHSMTGMNWLTVWEDRSALPSKTPNPFSSRKMILWVVHQAPFLRNPEWNRIHNVLRSIKFCVYIDRYLLCAFTGLISHPSSD